MNNQYDYPNLTPSIDPIIKGAIIVDDLITNIVTKAVWAAEQYDVNTICANTFEEHKKFRKMIPLI